jgi:hypothetical protein
MKYLISQDRLIELTVSMINPEIEEYSIHEESGQYQLRDREGKCIINYQSKSKELYYDHSLWDYVSKFIPIGYDTDTFREGIKTYFNSHFPDLIVRQVYGANIV